MTNLSAWKMAGVVFALAAATAIAAQAQTFTTLLNFDGIDGASPLSMSLVQGIDGNLYGTTVYGGPNFPGANDGGTIFLTTTEGSLTTLYDFCAKTDCTDGAAPYAGLLLASNGQFYGTTQGGGTYNQGTVFEISATGALTTLHSFDNSGDGTAPTAELIQAANGSFYGTTSGGNNYSGTVFEITPSGTLTTLHGFEGASTPSGLVQATDGNLYGTTYGGGTNKQGTVFKITQQGKFTRLHSFDGNDGANPLAVLIQGSDGNFYGTTENGGANNEGTIFKMSRTGALKTLYSFCTENGCTDGAYPHAGLIQATDTNFYGTTVLGGANNLGTIFMISSEGALTTIHSFDNSDGAEPFGGLLQATNGVFYGTTTSGGTLSCDSGYGCGTIFSMNVGLGPFVSFVHNPAKSRQPFGILGQGFTGTTGVELNGIPASFTVESDTLIRATVPAGATTGYVTVMIPSGTLTSNVPFYVIP